MEEELDEDLLNSTIRRLDADKKARKAAAGRAEEAWPAMSRDDQAAPRAADESAIEATIRRIEEQKAREAVGASDAPDEPAAAAAAPDTSGESEVTAPHEPDAPRAVDESAIEATIRRIEEEKQAREATAADGDPAKAAADIADQPAEAVALHGASDEPDATDPEQHHAPSVVDESAIEATIRRIEEQKQAREAADAVTASIESPQDVPADDAGEAAPLVVDESAIEATIRRIEEEQARRDAEDSATTDEPDSAMPVVPAAHVVETSRRSPQTAPITPVPPAPTEHSVPVQRPAETAPAAQLESLERIERGLAQTAQSLSAMLARFETILPLIEGSVQPMAAANVPRPIRPEPAPDRSRDDSWEDAPLISRMQTGLPPRPAILRDPSPAAATAEHLVEGDDDADYDGDYDGQPAAQPVAAAPPERRGFDLLPRSYRITVEERGRSVDLVPLHRALLGMEGVRDMSLLSYNNGIAIVSLETTDELEPDTLRECVSGAMARPARVEANNNAFLIKLGEE